DAVTDLRQSVPREFGQHRARRGKVALADKPEGSQLRVGQQLIARTLAASRSNLDRQLNECAPAPGRTEPVVRMQHLDYALMNQRQCCRPHGSEIEMQDLQTRQQLPDRFIVV